MMGGAGPVIVLGVGNLMMRDDGIGVWALRRLACDYDLPPELRLIEAAAAGAHLTAELDGAGHLIVIDAVLGGGPPGTIYRLAPDELPVIRRRLSAHEIGVAELLALLAAIGRRPETRIIGVQPLRPDEAGSELTPPLAAALPRVAAAVAEELRALGVAVREKAAARYA
jgi:hydrogenase maturation protease